MNEEDLTDITGSFTFLVFCKYCILYFFWLWTNLSSISIPSISNSIPFNPKELKDFDGCFLTVTAAEVTPVSCIAENQFKVCDAIIDLNESYQTLVRKKKAA